MTNVVSYFKINCKNVKGWYSGATRIEIYMSRRISAKGLVYDVTEYRYKGRGIDNVIHHGLGVSYDVARALFTNEINCLSDIYI